MSINCNSDNTTKVFGNGFGWGDKRVSVCLSGSTLVLKKRKISNRRCWFIYENQTLLIILTKLEIKFITIIYYATAVSKFSCHYQAI